MTQGKVWNHLVVIPPSLSLPQHIAIFNQLREDPMGAAFGDADGGSDVAEADSGVIGHARQDVGMVGQKVPASRVRP